MSEFSRNANRLLQSDFFDYFSDLKMFLSYIEETEIIIGYINECGGYTDIADEVKSVIKDSNVIFVTEIKRDEQTRIVYSVIKYICENYDSFPRGLLFSYSHSGSNKYNDMLKEWNNRFVKRLIDNIDNYLTKVGIRMGMDDNVVYNISGNQVNIAKDNATINAVQNNAGVDVSRLKELISAIRNELSADLSDEDKKDASECIDTIETELVSENPDEDKVKTGFKLLKRIDAGVKFSSACCSLLTFADKIHPFLGQIIPWFQSVIK